MLPHITFIYFVPELDPKIQTDSIYRGHTLGSGLAFLEGVSEDPLPLDSSSPYVTPLRVRPVKQNDNDDDE